MSLDTTVEGFIVGKHGMVSKFERSFLVISGVQDFCPRNLDKIILASDVRF